MEYFFINSRSPLYEPESLVWSIFVPLLIWVIFVHFDVGQIYTHFRTTPDDTVVRAGITTPLYVYI